MKVLLLCNEFPPRPHGGIGTFCADYAHGLQAAGHDVHIVEVCDDPYPQHGSAVPVTTLMPWRHSRFRSTASRVWVARHLAILCRDINADILEIPDFGGWLPFGGMPVPVVARLHGSTTLIAPHNDDRVKSSIRWFERRTLARADMWIAPSRFILNSTRAVFSLNSGSACVVHNPLPSAEDVIYDDYPARLLDGPIILFAGWINKRKGALELAHALRLVFHAHSSAHAVFLGSDVPYLGRSTVARIREIVGSQHTERLHFEGHVSRHEVYAWMRRASVFALPSRFESFGLVYFEAVRAGLPVVASNRSVEPELFGDGTALLVDPDLHDQLADAILSVLEQPWEAAAMAARAHHHLSTHFTVSQCVDGSVQAYRLLTSA